VIALSGKGVFLCQCQGSISTVLPADEICRFLEDRQPGLRVVWGDNLCDPGNMSRLVSETGFEPVVIGACSKLSTDVMLWDTPEKLPINPFSVRIIDLLGEVRSNWDTATLIDRIKLLLWAQVAGQARFDAMPDQSLKVHFNRHNGAISRRDLFKMVAPRYQVIPSIRPDICAGGQRCDICRLVCPCNAVISEGNAVSIDKSKCKGCGACVIACPRQAVSYPTCSPSELAAEMEGLLLSESNVLEPRIIAITCKSCRPSPDDGKDYPFREIPNMLPLEVPCIALVSPWLMLRAFDLGAGGLAVVSDNKTICSNSLDRLTLCGRILSGHLHRQRSRTGISGYPD